MLIDSLPGGNRSMGCITYANNMRGPGFYREHAENAGAAPHVQHPFAFK